MFSHQTELHDLKAENERLKDQIHQLQYLVAAAKLEITGKEIVVEQANAKIAELEKALKRTEWVEVNHSSGHYHCTECFANQDDDHKPGCIFLTL